CTRLLRVEPVLADRAELRHRRSRDRHLFALHLPLEVLFPADRNTTRSGEFDAEVASRDRTVFGVYLTGLQRPVEHCSHTVRVRSESVREEAGELPIRGLDPTLISDVDQGATMQ